MRIYRCRFAIEAGAQNRAQDPALSSLLNLAPPAFVATQNPARVLLCLSLAGSLGLGGWGAYGFN